MSPRFKLWMMRLPVWRWFARAAENRVTAAEAERYHDAKARAEFGLFRPYDAQPSDETKRQP